MTLLHRPLDFIIDPTLSLSRLVIEVLALIVALVSMSSFYKKYGLSRTIAFFLPLYIVAAAVEGDWIYHGRFRFIDFNVSFWNTPIAIILYYSIFYPVFLQYQSFGRTIKGRLKAMSIHLLSDVLVTTPLAIMFGLWTFRSTMFSTYPYIVPIVHIGEVLGVFLYVLFQEWLLENKTVKDRYKPLISIGLIVVLLAIYSRISFIFDWWI